MSTRTDLLIIDGRGVLFRAHDSHRMLSAEIDGEDVATGGLYGFLSVLPRVHQRYGKPRIAVAWEGKKNFRVRLYPKYKGRNEEASAEEQEMRAELWEQETRLIDSLSMLGVEQYRSVGGEADDAIARLCHEAAGPVLVYSGDSDMRQLVSGNVLVAAPGKKHDDVYDAKAVFEKHGVWPNQIAALKALAGDASDRIPGVKGIGPVAAVKLLNHYGTLRKALECAYLDDAGWPLTERQRALVNEGADDARLFFQLTNVRKDLPMIPMEYSMAPTKREVMDYLRRYQFRSMSSALEFAGLMDLGRKH